MVPHVPVCMYAHAREGRYAFAERVEKKTGTNWDRDQAGYTNATGEGQPPPRNRLALAKHAAAPFEVLLALAGLKPDQEAA